MNRQLCGVFKCQESIKKCKRKTKGIKKWCKSNLSENHNRTNLLLWIQYGVVMWCLGLYSDAQKTFDNIIAIHGVNVMGKTDASEKRRAVLMYKRYVELLVGLHKSCNVKEECQPIDMAEMKDSKSKAVTLLICLAGDESYSSMCNNPVSGIKVLRALQTYREQTEKLLQNSTEHRLENVELWTMKFEGCLLCHWINCYVMLEYFTTGTNRSDSC